jgi:hypothetical protein
MEELLSQWVSWGYELVVGLQSHSIFDMAGSCCLGVFHSQVTGSVLVLGNHLCPLCTLVNSIFFLSVKGYILMMQLKELDLTQAIPFNTELVAIIIPRSFLNSS